MFISHLLPLPVGLVSAAVQPRGLMWGSQFDFGCRGRDFAVTKHLHATVGTVIEIRSEFFKMPTLLTFGDPGDAPGLGALKGTGNRSAGCGQPQCGSTFRG